MVFSHNLISSKSSLVQGYEAFAAKDFSRAFVAFQQAAEEGDVEAMFFMAYCYDTGKGVERNYERAADYYHAAADGGDASAMYRLFEMYVAGDGVRKSDDEAYGWLIEAAKQKYPPAVKMLRLWGDALVEDDSEEDDADAATAALSGAVADEMGEV